MSWPDTRFMALAGIDLPIIQAPMAGAVGSAMAIEVCKAGGLGSLPCAMLDNDQIRSEIRAVRAHTSNPLNLNFFCHEEPRADPAREGVWMSRLAPYFDDLGLEVPAGRSPRARAPFDGEHCEMVEDLRPQIVSFHFGLPIPSLLARVKKVGSLVIASATTVEEARWLEERGCDAIIAQGSEAGGHRGMFLADDVYQQIGTMALVPQVVDAVSVPVIAAGGIADGRGIAAAMALGATAVQIGTGYLLAPEAFISEAHRVALRASSADQTSLTNVFTGKPARAITNRLVREIGPMSPDVTAFPTAAHAIVSLRRKSEAEGSTDFSSFWAGQSLTLARAETAGALTRRFAEDALACFRALNP